MGVLECVVKNRHGSPIEPYDYLFFTLPWNSPGRQLHEVEWMEMLDLS